MSISARQCKYLTDLLQNEIKERQDLIEKLRSDCPELAAESPQRLLSEGPEQEIRLSGAAESNLSQPERRRGGRPKKQPGKPGRKPRMTRSAKRNYHLSLDHVTSVLEAEGTPLTPFRIKAKLLERFNVQVSDEALGKVLKAGLQRNALCCPQQGEYAIPN